MNVARTKENAVRVTPGGHLQWPCSEPGCNVPCRGKLCTRHYHINEGRRLERAAKTRTSRRRARAASEIVIELSPAQLDRLSTWAVGGCLAHEVDATERVLWRKIHDAVKAAQAEAKFVLREAGT